MLGSLTACSYEDAQTELDSWYNAAGDWSSLTGYSTWGKLAAPSGNSRDFVFASIDVKPVTDSPGKILDKFGKRNDANIGVTGINVTDGALSEAMDVSEKPTIYITSIHSNAGGNNTKKVTCMLTRIDNYRDAFKDISTTEMFKLSGCSEFAMNEFLDLATKEQIGETTAITNTINVLPNSQTIRDEMKNVLGDVTSFGASNNVTQNQNQNQQNQNGGGVVLPSNPNAQTTGLIGKGLVCSGYNYNSSTSVYQSEIDVVKASADALKRKGFNVVVGDSSPNTCKSFYEKALESNNVEPKLNIIIFSGRVEETVTSLGMSGGAWCTLVADSDYNESSTEMEFCKQFAGSVASSGDFKDSRIFKERVVQNGVNQIIGGLTDDFSVKYNTGRISNITTSSSLFCITNYLKSPTVIVCYNCEPTGVQLVNSKTPLTEDVVIKAITVASAALE